MLTAYFLDTRQLAIAPDLNLPGPRSERPLFQCPDCLSPVVYRAGPRTEAHFAHVPGKHPDCDRAGESLAHLRIKLALYRAARAHPELTCLLEHKLGDRRCDVAFTWGDRKVAVEVQLSPLTEDEILDRTSNHLAHGYYTLWLVEPYFDLNEVKKNHVYKVPAFHKDIHYHSYGVLFTHHDGLLFRHYHMMGFKYKRWKSIYPDRGPLHLYDICRTTDGFASPPKHLRWWDKFSDSARDLQASL
jgi:competence CoiA-like predicted nuclease